MFSDQDLHCFPPFFTNMISFSFFIVEGWQYFKYLSLYSLRKFGVDNQISNIYIFKKTLHSSWMHHFSIERIPKNSHYFCSLMLSHMCFLRFWNGTSLLLVMNILSSWRLRCSAVLPSGYKMRCSMQIFNTTTKLLLSWLRWEEWICGDWQTAGGGVLETPTLFRALHNILIRTRQLVSASYFFHYGIMQAVYGMKPVLRVNARCYYACIMQPSFNARSTRNTACSSFG